MAVPPSYTGGGAPRVARLPQPDGTGAARMAQGVEAMARSFAGAQAANRETEEQVAQADFQVKLLERERDLRTRAAERSAALATMQGELQEATLRLRSTAASGAAGHEEATAREIEGFRSRFMESLGPDQELIDAFAPDVARIAAAVSAGESGWALQRRAESQATNFEQMSQQIGANLFAAASAGTATTEQLNAGIAQIDAAVERLGLPEDARASAKRSAYREAQSGAMRGTINFNPRGAIEQIDAGWGAGLFSPQELDQFRNAADVAARRAEAQAASVAGSAAETARAQASILIEDVNAGVAVDQAALQSALDRAKASQEPADIRQAHDLEIALAKNGTLNEYSTRTQGERRAAQREIVALPNWRSNPQLVAAHDALESLIDRDDARATNDQLGLFVEQSGQALAAFGTAERFAQGDAAAARLGRRAQYLTQEEADEHRRNWQGADPAGKADMIRSFAAFGTRRGRAMAFQIMPTRPEVAHLVNLAGMRDRNAGANLVREALDGAATPANERVTGSVAQRQSELARAGYMGALAQLPGNEKAALLWTAEAIYRSRAARNGVTSFDRPLWLESFQSAMGRAGSTGGLARGRGGALYALPRGMTPGDMTRLIAAADASAFQRASGNDVPVWTNGQVLTLGQFRGLIPVLVSDDGVSAIYRFRSETGFVRSRARRGEEYEVDIRALGRLVAGRR